MVNPVPSGFGGRMVRDCRSFSSCLLLGASLPIALPVGRQTNIQSKGIRGGRVYKWRQAKCERIKQLLCELENDSDQLHPPYRDALKRMSAQDLDRPCRS